MLLPRCVQAGKISEPVQLINRDGAGAGAGAHAVSRTMADKQDRQAATQRPDFSDSLDECRLAQTDASGVG